MALLLVPNLPLHCVQAPHDCRHTDRILCESLRPRHVISGQMALAVLGFVLRLFDLSLWFVTLGPLKTLMLLLKGAP